MQVVVSPSLKQQHLFDGHKKALLARMPLTRPRHSYADPSWAKAKALGDIFTAAVAYACLDLAISMPKMMQHDFSLHGCYVKKFSRTVDNSCTEKFL